MDDALLQRVTRRARKLTPAECKELVIYLHGLGLLNNAETKALFAGYKLGEV